MNWNASSILTAKNFYECLQISREASSDEVTRAFRQLAKQCHPDQAPKWIQSGALFRRLREAYETLSNPTKREIYDADLAKRQSILGTVERGARSKSHFSQGTKRTWHPSKTATYAHSSDLDMTAKISIPWGKGVHGGVQKIRLTRPHDGGHPLRTDFISVPVPAGCPIGHHIRVPLHGRVEKIRHRAGHLHLKVEYQQDSRFRIVGPHLHTFFEINPWDSALGGLFAVDSPLGPINFQVSPGARHLQSIRVPGVGLPQEGGQRGDLFVCLKTRAIAPQTVEQKHLWAALKKAHE